MTRTRRGSANIYIVFYKPYGVLSQFTDSAGRVTLSSYGPFPKDAYPVGRLDTDSEGLLLLTNDGVTKHRLLEPRFGHERTYLAQVERIPDEAALHELRSGVIIDGRRTKEAKVRLLDYSPDLPPRPVPIRFRKNVPTSWIEITLREGRNRQVRKMTAAVGHPTLRLVRVGFGPLRLLGMQPGESRILSVAEVETLIPSLDVEVPQGS
jgi:23S rRNA pseudouridine2457 synthase